MIYLIIKIIVWLLLAFVVGALLGWWLRRLQALQAQAEYQTQLAALSESATQLNIDLSAKTEQLATAEQLVSVKEQELLNQTNELLRVQRLHSQAELRIAEQEEEATQLSGELELERSALSELQLQQVALTGKHETQVARLQLEISALLDKVAVADNDIVALTATNSDLERLQVELRAQLDQAEGGAQQQVKKLQAKVEGLEQQHSKLQRQRDEQQTLAQNLDKSNSRLEAKVASLLEDLNSQQQRDQQQQEAQNQQLLQLGEQLEQAKRLAQERQLELDANGETMNSNEQQVKRLTDDVRRWRQRIPDLQVELDEKEAQVRERDGRLATFAEQLAERSRRLQNSQRALSALRGSRTGDLQAQARIAQLQAQLSHARQLAVAATQDASPITPAAAVRRPPAPSAATATEATPAQRFYAQPPARIDDLQRIKGIGPKLEQLLHGLGVYQFDQIARFSADDVAWLDDRLNFKGRIERDQWIAQATELRSP